MSGYLAVHSINHKLGMSQDGRCPEGFTSKRGLSRGAMPWIHVSRTGEIPSVCNTKMVHRNLTLITFVLHAGELT